MRHIIRQVGSYNPIFDEDIGENECIFIDRSVKVGYISHDTDSGDAVVINLRSTKGVYVDRDGSNFLNLTTI